VAPGIGPKFLGFADGKADQSLGLALMIVHERLSINPTMMLKEPPRFVPSSSADLGREHSRNVRETAIDSLVPGLGLAAAESACEAGLHAAPDVVESRRVLDAVVVGAIVIAATPLGLRLVPRCGRRVGFVPAGTPGRWVVLTVVVVVGHGGGREMEIRRGQTV